MISKSSRGDKLPDEARDKQRDFCRVSRFNEEQMRYREEPCAALLRDSSF